MALVTASGGGENWFDGIAIRIPDLRPRLKDERRGTVNRVGEGGR